MLDTLPKGTRVLLLIPKNAKTGSIVLEKKYNNKTYSVSKVHHTKIGTYYELEGLKSKHGIPYSFAREWLIPA